MKILPGTLALDTEGTGLDWAGDSEIFGYSTGTLEGVLDARRFDKGEGDRVRNEAYLDRMIEERTPFIFHNAKHDIHFIEKHRGVELPLDYPFHDTMILSQLLRNLAPNHQLKHLAWELGGYPRDDEQLVKRYAAGTGDYSIVPDHIMDLYMRRDADRTSLLFNLFAWSLNTFDPDPGIEKVYAEELKLIRTTIRMERRGIRICPVRTKQLIAWLQEQVFDIMEALYDLTGESFNPDSPKQLQRILFKRRGLPILEYTETGQPSTKKDVLVALFQQVNDPVLNLIMKYRSYAGGIAALSSYLELADGEDLLHPNIGTNFAKTGRESCREPNLQNVSKEDVLKNPYPVPARKCFRPKPGYVNIFLDYSGQELRGIAHYVRGSLLNAFLNGLDPHEIAAGIWYPGFDPGWKFTADRKSQYKQERGAAKNCNYAIPYGGGRDKLASVLQLSLRDTLERWEHYKEKFPEVVDFPRKITGEVRSKGYVRTAFGRKTYVPHDKPYMGVNYLIQGTGADALKVAQNRVDDYLRRTTGDEVGLILPIHDEIVLEVPRNRLRDLGDILPDIGELMKNFSELRLPLDVECKMATTSWADAKEIDFYGREVRN
jgi:DNA polymerase-1